MRILGLVGATHDSGIAILENGRIDVVIEEERLRREKRTKRFPRLALISTMGADGRGLEHIDAIVTPWDVRKLRKSFLKAVFGRPPMSFNLLPQRSHSPQANEIAILNTFLMHKLRREFPLARPPRIINVGHHDSHAAAFFVSPFEDAAVLVMDGYGDDAATSVYSGRGNRLERQWNSSFFNSIGMVYTFVTDYLGFKGLADEGKVMALAAYGERTFVERFRDLITLTADGRYIVNMDYFSFDTHGEIRPLKKKFYDTFGPPRLPGEAIDDRHRAVAFALQAITEEAIVHIVRAITKRQKAKSLVFAGGVALNCVANARILEMTDIERVWVPPGASDTGTPLGACLWHYHQTLGNPRVFELKHGYWGLEYSTAEIDRAVMAADLKADVLSDDDLFNRVAQDLASGGVIGWFQGRFEMGPRALGNRSILADPRRADMRDIINSKIKQRESFRPFAPAILEERASEYFAISQPDPFMTIAPHLRPERVGDIPAAVHADGTGRIQTVARDANPRFYRLIETFAGMTGVPVLLNTSFNRQEPIVASPAEAISCFLRTNMDVVVIGNHYIRRAAD
ncbi:MAG: carbamoyltransferase family protein [Hyphomicrobium sp.]